MKYRPEEKINILFNFMLLAFFILFFRLFYLQVVKGNYYLERSETNFIQEMPVKHSRGKIFDRFGNVLVDNRKAYDLFITFALIPNTLKDLRIITSPLRWDKKKKQEIIYDLIKRIEEKTFEIIEIDNNIPKRICLVEEELIRSHSLEGVSVEYLDNNKRSCNILIDSRKFPSKDQLINRLSEILQVKKDSVEISFNRAEKKSLGLGYFKPTLLLSDIGFDAYARLENAIGLGLLSGLNVMASQRRRYIFNDLASHVIGYVNQISIDELKEKAGIYKSGDYIGRYGLEANYESYLRGEDGVVRAIVDAKGRRYSEDWEEMLLGDEHVIAPKAGFDLRLNIDKDLQKAAHEYFLGISGSIVVLDIQTGAILALASFPNFDANLLVKADNVNYVKQLLNDKNRPLRNRAIQDHYAPGSTFKAFTAISGLENELITTRTNANCTGTFKLHRTEWRCFKREGHNHISLADSLKASCDFYYYELGHRLGLGRLSSTALQLGFGNKTGIDLKGEIPGIVPTIEWYKKRSGFVPPGAVVNMAIGQGDITVTPVQLAVAYGAIANGGKILKPQIVQEILDENGNVIKTFEPEIKEDISDVSVAFPDIMKGLSNVTEPGGTASSLRYNAEFSDIAAWLNKGKIVFAGKTGTAQVVKLAKHVKHLEVEDVAYEHRDHAWFVSIFPYENPKIVAAAISENSGFGGLRAAPWVARVIMKYEEKYGK